MNADDINNIDWHKIFYAAVMSVIMGIQMYHGSEINRVQDMHEIHSDELDRLHDRIKELENEDKR